ncbi:MAG: hypothetical protein KIT85_07400 [Pseudolabrys sp.]|nr:hypothetical protein [Pseudolabrys sp.]
MTDKFAKRVGNIHITIEQIGAEASLHDYGLTRKTWLTGVRLLNRYGADMALEKIDARAEKAADRGDYRTARRWRDVITAIHAMTEIEKLPGDETH